MDLDIPDLREKSFIKNPLFYYNMDSFAWLFNHAAKNHYRLMKSKRKALPVPIKAPAETSVG